MPCRWGRFCPPQEVRGPGPSVSTKDWVSCSRGWSPASLGSPLAASSSSAHARLARPPCGPTSARDDRTGRASRYCGWRGIPCCASPGLGGRPRELTDGSHHLEKKLNLGQLVWGLHLHIFITTINNSCCFKNPLGQAMNFSILFLELF